MPITNTWTVTQLDCHSQQGDNANIIFTTHWTLDATDGTYTGRTYGLASIAYEEDTSFTPYEELTEAQVVGWTLDALGQERVADLEAEVARQIDVQVKPPSISPPLPWG